MTSGCGAAQGELPADRFVPGGQTYEEPRNEPVEETENESLRFVAYGDSRSEPADHESIIDAISETDPQLILHSGDLWDGYSASEWLSTVRKHENLSSLLDNNLFLVARGNHESESEVLEIQPPIVRFDSVVYAIRIANVFFVSLAQNPEDEEDFLAEWLPSELAQSAAWRVVFAHEPIFSSGSHGADGMEDVESLFDTYGVDLYLSGHDHHYERTYQVRDGVVVDEGNALRAGQGTVYVVTGGGGAPLYDVGSSDWTALAESTLHFLEFEATGSTLTVVAKTPFGTVLDSFTISR